MNYDVTIVVGGMVGMAAALGLAQLKLKVCLIESKSPENNYHTSYDHRTLVVNKASKNFWNHLKIWQGIKDQAVAIKSVHGESATAAPGKGTSCCLQYNKVARSNPPPAESPMKATFFGSMPPLAPTNAP